MARNICRAPAIFKSTKRTAMALQHTTEIPLDDLPKAQALYQGLKNQKCILMIVLGDSKATQDGVQIADNLAPTSPGGFTRKVMWVKNHTVLKEELEPYLHAAEIIKDDTPYEEIKCFCLTLSPRKAQSRIHKNGVMDYIRVEQLYIEAESQSL